MRKFFQRCAVLIIILWVVNAVLTWGFLRMVSERQIVRCQKQFDAFEGHPSVLAIGDSHLQRGFDVRVAGERTFCYTSPGENWMQTYYKLRWVLDSGRTVERVVLSADPHSFSSISTARAFDAYYWARFVDPVEVGRRRGSVSKTVGYHMKGRLWPWAGEFGLLDDFLELRQKRREGDDDTPEMLRGFVVDPRDFTRYDVAKRRRKAELRAAGHLKGADYMDEEMLHYFAETLKLCAELDIPVTVVRMPVTRAYYEACERTVADWQHPDGKAGSLDRLYEAVAEIIAAVDGDIELRDYHDLFFDEDALYSDPDHLNARGAAKFMDVLMRDLSED
jgi:hypothetical protein